MTPDEIRAHLTALQEHDLPVRGGHTLSYVYDSGLAEVDTLGREALAMYGGSNGLDPTAFPSLLQMENDLVGMAAELLHAPPSAVGTVTSGGTESILLAVQAARDAHPDIGKPEMVLPATAHAAFHKAAHYFGVRPVLVDVDPRTFKPDPALMAAALTTRTVLVVASAPSYAHGVVDPVPQIADAAAERGVRCHVDACIGGWVLPFYAEQGVPVTPFDFAAPGVTSISVDLHKYAYAPKGTSILLHRDADMRRPQYFAFANWPGYTMVNSTTQSTKSGGPLAAAWAVTRAIGRDGYADLAARLRDGVTRLVAAVEGIDHVRVAVPPESTLVALYADDACDVFTLSDEMAARGWYAQPQLRFQGFPPSLHLSLSPATVDRLPQLVGALAEAVTAAVAAGPVAVPPELATAIEHLDPTALDAETFEGLLTAAGLVSEDGLRLPERMGPVNVLLDRAPPGLREAMLVAFLDRLTRPTRTNG